MTREIVLDTETTGLDPRDGHRVIEIACVELRDYLPTGRSFHAYINPERDIDPDAQRVHGISRDFLEDKPVFGHRSVCGDFLDFIGDASLIAHNAGFDRGFVNAELSRIGVDLLPEERWIDSLAMAQQRYPGMYNSLDALCKRFKISLESRDKHGALIDAELLAGVYLELRGGREVGLDLGQTTDKGVAIVADRVTYGARPRPVAPRLTASELAAHLGFISNELKGTAVWLSLNPDPIS